MKVLKIVRKGRKDQYLSMCAPFAQVRLSYALNFITEAKVGPIFALRNIGEHDFHVYGNDTFLILGCEGEEYPEFEGKTPINLGDFKYAGFYEVFDFWFNNINFPKFPDFEYKWPENIYMKWVKPIIPIFSIYQAEKFLAS